MANPITVYPIRKPHVLEVGFKGLTYFLRKTTLIVRDLVFETFYLLSFALLGLQQRNSGRMDVPQSRLQVDLQVGH